MILTYMNAYPYRTIALAQSTFVLFLMSLYFLNLYAPSIPSEDIYFPYFLAAGPLVAFAGIYLGHAFFTPLLTFLPSPIAMTGSIVIIPAITDILLGSLQWFFVFFLIRKIRRKLKIHTPPAHNTHAFPILPPSP